MERDFDVRFVLLVCQYIVERVAVVGGGLVGGGVGLGASGGTVDGATETAETELLYSSTTPRAHTPNHPRTHTHHTPTAHTTQPEHTYTRLNGRKQQANGTIGRHSDRASKKMSRVRKNQLQIARIAHTLSF